MRNIITASFNFHSLHLNSSASLTAPIRTAFYSTPGITKRQVHQAWYRRTCRIGPCGNPGKAGSLSDSIGHNGIFSQVLTSLVEVAQYFFELSDRAVPGPPFMNSLGETLPFLPHFVPVL